MKNNKLSLEKFKIAKLNNPKMIFGGGTTDANDGTGVDPKEKVKCLETSAILIKE